MNWTRALFVFLVLHFLVYPASNGYNSYMDRDETPIGGLSNPLQPTKQLFYVTVVMDAVAVILSFLIEPEFGTGVVIYIIASRLYSYRGIRLKQYPVAGFMTVFIFQGAVIFYIVYHACTDSFLDPVPLLPCIIASLLIGALYPLTQIYQHEADKNDGVITISYLLGKRGSFLFSMFLFGAATVLFYLLFKNKGETGFFLQYLLFMLPVVLFFMYWMRLVWKDALKADFRNSLVMNILSTTCTAFFFISLIIRNIE